MSYSHAQESPLDDLLFAVAVAALVCAWSFRHEPAVLWLLISVFLQNQPGAGFLDTRVGVAKAVLILLGFGFIRYDVSEERPMEPTPKG